MSESLIIVGGGGREHALGALGHSFDQIYFAPGNAGTAEAGANLNIAYNPKNLRPFIEELAQAAKQYDAFTVVGPELPLKFGIVDYFNRLSLPIFGPTMVAARLETSKAFAAKVNDEFGIPQPEYRIFEKGQLSKLQAFLTHRDVRDWVFKANGPAGGHGVLLPQSRREALEYANNLMVGGALGAAGETIVLQRREKGPELSVFAVCDGERALLLPGCRDFKRLNDGEQLPNPNTGGMMAYGPVDEADPAFLAGIKDTMVMPLLKGMKSRGIDYRGILYLGLILTDEGPKVLEYNARFGDPELQVLAMMLGEDLYPLLRQAAEGRLQQNSIKTLGGYAVTTALAAPGYPNETQVGLEVFGLDQEYDDVRVFHGATRAEGRRVFNIGGRVAYVTSRAESLTAASDNIHAAIGKHAIYFEGMQHRDLRKNLS